MKKGFKLKNIYQHNIKHCGGLQLHYQSVICGPEYLGIDRNADSQALPQTQRNQNLSLMIFPGSMHITV